MKAEKGKELPAFDLTKIDEKAAQADNKIITKVFTVTGAEYDIIPGSFKFKISVGDRPQHFVQFKAVMPHVLKETIGANARDNVRNIALKLHTMEFFPAHIAGVAYLADDAEDDQ